MSDWHTVGTITTREGRPLDTAPTASQRQAQLRAALPATRATLRATFAHYQGTETALQRLLFDLDMVGSVRGADGVERVAARAEFSGRARVVTEDTRLVRRGPITTKKKGRAA